MGVLSWFEAIFVVVSSATRSVVVLFSCRVVVLSSLFSLDWGQRGVILSVAGCAGFVEIWRGVSG